MTNELNVEAIRNKLLSAVKAGATNSGKNYDTLDKILFIPAPMMKINRKRWNQLDFGGVQ